MSFNYFKAAAHATAYQQFRPSPPPALVQRIVNYLGENIPRDSFLTAVDVGCGGGQSTEILSPYFKSVIGIDPSATVIAEAQKDSKFSNVKYVTGSAESIEIPDGSVQLVTAGQACHWFDLAKFYSQVERILVPGGVLALYGYLLPRPRYGKQYQELCNIVDKYYNLTLGEYVLPGSKLAYLENYRGEDFSKVPFVDGPMLRDDSTCTQQNVTLADLTGYVSSWSAFQNYLQKEGEEKAAAILSAFEKEFMEVISETKPANQIPLTIDFQYFLLMGRK